MPNYRSSRITSLGLIIGFGLAIVIYITQPYIIQTLVYTKYSALVNPLQLYELAWILATIDLLLNFSYQISLILWLIVALLVGLLVRKLSVSLSTLSAAILLPAGTWFLFTIKFFYLPEFSIAFLLSFLLWQTVVPLGFMFGLSTLVTLPFILYRRQKPSISMGPKTIQSICSKCGAVYRSQPLICVNCGSEGTIVSKSEEKS